LDILWFKEHFFSRGVFAREHSPFVTITIEVAIGWLFEDGYAKEAARYFQIAGNSFRTMLKKLPYRCMLNVRTNGEHSPLHMIFSLLTTALLNVEGERPRAWATSGQPLRL